MVTFRIERLNREFLRLIADILANRLKIEALSGVVLTQVDCSRDLSHAKVYYTLLKDDKIDETGKALEASSGKIRGFLGREMHIKQIPELHFIYDDSEKKARDIEELIDRVIKEDSHGKK